MGIAKLKEIPEFAKAKQTQIQLAVFSKIYTLILIYVLHFMYNAASFLPQYTIQIHLNLNPVWHKLG